MHIRGIESGLGYGAATPVLPVAAASPATSQASDGAHPAPVAPGGGTVVPPGRDAVEEAASQLEEYVRSVGRSLQFRVDDDSGRIVVSVHDLSTGELIRQMPSEAALRFAQQLKAETSGVSSLIIQGLA